MQVNAITTTIGNTTYTWAWGRYNIVTARDSVTGDVIRSDAHVSFEDSVYWALACAACGTEWEGHYPEYWNDCAPAWLDEMTV